jgi:hypothetical protein
MSIKIKQYHHYRAIIKYHRTDDLKPDAIENGIEVFVQACWVAEDAERFPGDMIFLPNLGHYTLPERDLEIIEEVPFELYRNSIC